MVALLQRLLWPDCLVLGHKDFTVYQADETGTRLTFFTDCGRCRRRVRA